MVSFLFRGPEGRLNLVAHNLNTFIRMAEGVDDETWCYHLQSGHFSEWIRGIVKNQELADEMQAIEQRRGTPQQTRESIIRAIRAKYTSSE